MFHCATLLRLYARDGAAIFTLVPVFANTTSALGPTVTQCCATIVRHSHDIRIPFYAGRLRRWIALPIFCFRSLDIYTNPSFCWNYRIYLYSNPSFIESTPTHPYGSFVHIHHVLLFHEYFCLCAFWCLSSVLCLPSPDFHLTSTVLHLFIFRLLFSVFHQKNFHLLSSYHPSYIFHLSAPIVHLSASDSCLPSFDEIIRAFDEISIFWWNIPNFFVFSANISIFARKYTKFWNILGNLLINYEILINKLQLGIRIRAFDEIIRAFDEISQTFSYFGLLSHGVHLSSSGFFSWSFASLVGVFRFFSWSFARFYKHIAHLNPKNGPMLTHHRRNRST